MSSKEQIKVKHGDVYAVSTAIGYAFFKLSAQSMTRKSALYGCCKQFCRQSMIFRLLEYIPHKKIRNWYEICLIGSVTIYEKRITKLTDKFLALSSHGIWNIAYLRERIE